MDCVNLPPSIVKSLKPELKMTKRLILMLIVAFACTLSADAQGWLGRVRDRATEAAKRTVEYNVERKTVDAVDDAMNPDRNRDSNR